MKRAEVVLISTTSSGRLMLAFGVDTISGQLGGWGGRIEQGENVYEAAARELAEESLGLFDFSPRYVERKHLLSARTDRTTCFFLQIPAREMLKFPLAFRARHRREEEETEMSGVRILFLGGLRLSCQTNEVYEVDREMIAVAWDSLMRVELRLTSNLNAGLHVRDNRSANHRDHPMLPDRSMGHWFDAVLRSASAGDATSPGGEDTQE